MNKILTILFLTIPFYFYSQNTPDIVRTGKNISQNSNQKQIIKKWFSNFEIEFGVNNGVTYNYGILDNNGALLRGAESELKNKTSFGLLYNINYPIFNKLTIGAVSGFQYQSQLKVSALKLGAILRYHFINYKSVNINLMTNYNIALSDNIGSGMANVRLGLQFPIKTTNDFILNLNVFTDYNYYEYLEPILIDINDKPTDIIYRSLGFSLGLQF